MMKKILQASLGESKTGALLRRLENVKTRARRFHRLVNRRNRVPEISCPVETFGDKAHHVFFGYYDVSPVSFDDSMVLSVRAPLAKRLSGKPIKLDVGYFKRKHDAKGFIAIGETTSWCWQQGCRLQWYPLCDAGKNHRVIYNRPDRNQYRAVIQDVDNGEILHEIPYPIYALTTDGRYGFTLNFSRLGRLRPGYGYDNFPDKTMLAAIPEKDGIWRIDLLSNQCDLLFTIADIADFEPTKTMKNAVHYFNHISANPSGNRILFFHVWINRGQRFTRLITCGLRGEEKFNLVREGHVSHFAWKDEEQILCYATHSDSGMNYHLYRDRTDERRTVGRGFLTLDGHPSYALGSEMVITDTCRDRFGERHLLLFDESRPKPVPLGSFFHPYRYAGEYRCDLHPRWSPSGKYVAIDSAHEGQRRLYLMDVSKAIQTLRFSNDPPDSTIQARDVA